MVCRCRGIFSFIYLLTPFFMTILIVSAFIFKLLVIPASILWYISAISRIPAMKECLNMNQNMKKQMYLLVWVIPISYALLTLILPVPSVWFNSTVFLVMLWILVIFFWTESIFGSKMQEYKISLEKFVCIYAISTTIFTLIFWLTWSILIRTLIAPTF